MAYHCNNDEENPYIDNSIEGEIDRRTRFGDGIPKGDLYMFNGKITYGKIRKKWKCLICNFERGRCGRYQVFGRAASTHCFPTAKNNERWSIPNNEERNEAITETLPKNIDNTMAHDISYGNVEVDVIGDEIIYICKHCTKFRNLSSISVRNHLPHAHKRCPTGRVICPYYPSTFGGMDELKRHFRKNKCPNVDNKTGNEIRNDINQINNEFNAQEFI